MTSQHSSIARSIEARTLSSRIPDFKFDNPILQSAFYQSVEAGLIESVALTLSQECSSNSRTGVVVEVILNDWPWQSRDDI